MANNISLRDRNLIAKSFKLMCTGIDNVTIRDHLNKDLYYNFFSSAIGDNRYINPVPQFGPATDPRYSQFLSSSYGGMGTQYKKIYDDNASLLTITVGVPEFTGILTFLERMFDPVAAIQANKGRSPSLAFYFGQGLGTLAFWPIQLISIGMTFLDFLMDTPRNQYYYVKPSMGMYLTAANNFLNDVATAQGFIKPVLAIKKPPGAPINGVDPEEAGNYYNEIARLNALFPDCINDDGTIDVIRLVSLGTRKYRKFLSEIEKLNERTINSAQEKYDAMADIAKNIQFNAETLSGKQYGVNELMQKELNTTGKYRAKEEGYYPEKASAFTDQDAYTSILPQAITTDTTGTGTATAAPSDASSMNTDGSGTTTTASSGQGEFSSASESLESVTARLTAATDNVTDSSWAGQVADLVKTSWYGGLDAITWRVEHLGEVTDNFSNSATQSAVADKFNSMSKAANDLRFDLAGGMTGVGVVDGVISGLKEVAMGGINSIGIANIPMALMNNSYINIPDHWAESSANLHKETYRFYFEATYAHPYSQLMNIWVPLSLLMPIILPLSAGPSAHTSPFLCKIFSKSRAIMRTCMVDSATISFGQGVGGWKKDRKPLNCTVDISFVDLEKHVSLPISRAVSLLDMTNPAEAVNRMLIDTGKYTDYITRLSGSDYLDTVLRWNKLSRRLTTAKNSISQSVSAGNIAGIVNDSILNDVGRLFHQQFPR